MQKNLPHGWQFVAVGSDVGQINEVTLRRARLVLGWVTVSGFDSSCVSRRNEYWPKGGDALRLGVKADMVLFAGNTVIHI